MRIAGGEDVREQLGIEPARGPKHRLWTSRTDGDQSSRRLGRGRRLRPGAPAADAAPASPPADPSCGTWRDRRDAAVAKMAELKYGERRGELIDVVKARR